MKKIHDFIEDWRNGQRIYEELKGKKKGAVYKFKEQQTKQLSRSSYKMTLKNSRRVDFMIASSSKGITEDPRKHVLTDKARREAAKKKRKRAKHLAARKEEAQRAKKKLKQSNLLSFLKN